tara:strand:+ start:1306 stop:1890 length:585 start_codon:yes stop_codon:yes gene_type:complete
MKVLITGVSQDGNGLGYHLASCFEKHGHFVLRHKGRKHADLSKNEDICALVAEAKECEVDTLINNAAIVCPNKQFGEYNKALIQIMIEVNLLAPILLSNLLLTNLKNIVNINSMVGLEVKSPRTIYSATKWGLRGFSNSLKNENCNINILDVYPTNIKTTPDRKNAMDVNVVAEKIYESLIRKEKKLILDGRKK